MTAAGRLQSEDFTNFAHREANHVQPVAPLRGAAQRRLKPPSLRSRPLGRSGDQVVGTGDQVSGTGDHIASESVITCRRNR